MQQQQTTRHKLTLEWGGWRRAAWASKQRLSCTFVMLESQQALFLATLSDWQCEELKSKQSAAHRNANRSNGGYDKPFCTCVRLYIHATKAIKEEYRHKGASIRGKWAQYIYTHRHTHIHRSYMYVRYTAQMYEASAHAWRVRASNCTYLLNSGRPLASYSTGCLAMATDSTSSGERWAQSHWEKSNSGANHHRGYK